MNNVEIMSPVGSYESLASAIKTGANSIYFGAGKLNMRSRSSANFQFDDIEKISKICSKNRIKSYIVLNTIIYDSELDEAKKICDTAKSANISAIIASDISVIQYASSINLEVHISVQANVSNIDAVKFFANFATVMVLARELTLPQIKNIIDTIKKENITGPNGELIKIELFVHGALCVAISGKCYMSLALYNASANRGGCYQTCRRGYKVSDLQTDDELNIENKYIMSPKDLCTISFLDSLLDAGVSILKLEGRGRSADYVYTVTETYKKAVDMWIDGSFTSEKAFKMVNDLESVFNRGFWHGGYYLGEKLGEWCGTDGNRAKYQKEFVGYISNYFSKIRVSEITMMAGKIEKEQTLVIIGPTTGTAKFKIDEIRLNLKPANSAEKGDLISIPTPERLRKNDKVYLLTERKFGDGIKN